MLRVVSVQADLEDIKAHLTSCGYQVIDMEKCISPVEAVVYRGPTVTSQSAAKVADNTLVINAAGLSGEQVMQQIEDRL